MLATMSLHDPDSLAALLAFDRPLADSMHACARLDSLPPAPDVGSVVHHARTGERFACRIEPDRDIVITIVADTSGDGPDGIDSLRIAFPAGDVQTLDGGGDPPPIGAPFLVTQDLDGDRRRELMLLAWWGVTGNAGWSIWRLDDATGRFLSDVQLTDLGRPEPIAGTPCVRTRGNGGMAGMIFGASVHCRVDGRLIEVYRESQDWSDAGFFLRDVRFRRPGEDSLRLVRVDTVREPARLRH